MFYDLFLMSVILQSHFLLIMGTPVEKKQTLCCKDLALLMQVIYIGLSNKGVACAIWPPVCGSSKTIYGSITTNCCSQHSYFAVAIFGYSDKLLSVSQLS